MGNKYQNLLIIAYFLAQNCFFFLGASPHTPNSGGHSLSPDPRLQSHQYLSPTFNLTPTPLVFLHYTTTATTTTTQPGLLRTKVYSALHPSGVGERVPAAAGKAKAGMAHSDCGWTCGRAGKTVWSLENTCHTWALLRWWFTTKMRYSRCTYLYLYLLPLLLWCSDCKITRRRPRLCPWPRWGSLSPCLSPSNILQQLSQLWQHVWLQCARS